MNDIVLDVSDVNKTFGGLQALSNINLKINKGKTHAVIGPNGAGKSTLLNVCVGRLEPDTGSVMFDGTNLTGRTPHEINQLGVARVFQTPEIFLDLTLLQNVEIAALARRDGSFSFNPFKAMAAEKELTREAEHMLGEVGLGKLTEEHTGNLSRGDKRRLEMAMCLIQHPKLLLLDEPTAGMSRHDTNRTIDLLKRIKEQGMTKVIIEHDMHVVFSLADWITVLAQGTIIAEGTPDEIRGNPKVKEAYLGGAEV
ncbi:ABC transporter ATP-binding protein [Marivibrio halodurans]|uniref:ABC transporter ATP-binding protein n=1 Tax=Marivibrio halodurans TaxID=2039722 RepID=A0A8J7SKI1_9PROT|nr:ABC transporter ATP-binding protein [Marivibrio halodurans]MBP5858488.1 ABC transporter ATP-binding protein [Marivibrio halodurans]